MTTPTVYTPPYRPRAKQQEALDKMDGREAFALFMAMRTGKTKVVLDNFGRLELAGEMHDLLIIAPGGVYRTWEGAAKEHWSDDLRSRAVIHVWDSNGGTGHAKRLAAFLAINDRPRMFCINVEALSSVQRARDATLAFLSAKDRRTYGAIDESIIIKNPSSARTKFINTKIAPLCDVRNILSGLPTPKSPMDLYAQCEYLDWRILGQRSFYAFRARYAVLRNEFFGGRTVQVIVGFRNTEELHEKLQPYSHRVLLEDCYDLPPKMYSIKEVELTPEQKRAYQEMKEFASITLGEAEHVTATIVIVQLLRLHQVLCGHVMDDQGVVHEVPENRTAALLELLEDYDGKAIIWASYGADILKLRSALEAEYGPGSVACFWGGNQATREEEEVRYKTDPDCRWMIATAAAGGRGREWSVADLVVYYSNTPDLDHRSQSEERAQAVGKTRSVGYVDLVARGTVDEKFLKALREKISLSDLVTGDKWKDWVI